MNIMSNYNDDMLELIDDFEIEPFKCTDEDWPIDNPFNTWYHTSKAYPDVFLHIDVDDDTTDEVILAILAQYHSN